MAMATLAEKCELLLELAEEHQSYSEPEYLKRLEAALCAFQEVGTKVKGNLGVIQFCYVAATDVVYCVFKMKGRKRGYLTIYRSEVARAKAYTSKFHQRRLYPDR